MAVYGAPYVLKPYLDSRVPGIRFCVLGSRIVPFRSVVSKAWACSIPDGNNEPTSGWGFCLPPSYLLGVVCALTRPAQSSPDPNAAAPSALVCRMRRSAGMQEKSSNLLIRGCTRETAQECLGSKHSWQRSYILNPKPKRPWALAVEIPCFSSMGLHCVPANTPV